MITQFLPNQFVIIALQLFIENILIIETSTMREQKHCKNREQGIFSDTLREHLIVDCFNYETNQTYSCLPIHLNWYLIRWERDLNFLKYSICPINTTINYKLVNKIIYSCIRKYPEWCEKDIFSVYNDYRQIKSNSTKILIFPKQNMVTEYQKNYIMNFNDWVYNFGGIVGLWFGWSALSLTGVIFYIKSLYKNLLIIYIHLKLFWKYFIKLCKKVFLIIVQCLIWAIFFISDIFHNLKHKCNMVINIIKNHVSNTRVEDFEIRSESYQNKMQNRN